MIQFRGSTLCWLGHVFALIVMDDGEPEVVVPSKEDGEAESTARE